MRTFFLVTLVIGCLTSSVFAQRGGRGGGGFHAGGAQMAQPMQQARPNMGGMQQMQRPQVSMGGMNRQMPNNMNMGGGSMPQVQQRPQFQQQPTMPQFNRPSGGLTPGGGISPGVINNGGMVRPGTGLGGSSRPTIPNIGQGQTTLPGVGQRPNVPGQSRPGGIINPDVKPVTRPGTLPGNVNRPGAGVDVGLDRPIRPTPPIAKLPDTRPGSGQRPIGPVTNRPVINKSLDVGNQVNTQINRRPAWVNVNNVTINNINNQWNTAINRPTMNNWINNNPNRYQHWNGWGNGVRNNWRYYHNHNNWFGHDWWSRYHPWYGGWHYRYWFPYYPYSYWWSVPTWAGITSWFTWGAGWQPVYYDYGMGGNVVYQNNMVYVGGQQVASANDFAQTAAALATAPAPANEEQAAAAEWMPLGTFALSTSEKDTEPTRIIQLAVTKDGIVGGTLFNNQTQQSASIQGQVDRTTQRVAFRIGDKDNIVVETGIYNLTQNEAPVMVHFGTDRTENYLLIRLQNEEGNQTK